MDSKTGGQSRQAQECVTCNSILVFDQARTKLFYLQQPLPELHEMLTAECDRIIRLKLLVETLMNKENEQ